MGFRFRARVIDAALPEGYYAQTALADLDGDGQLEYVVGQTLGDVFWYKREPSGRWTRHLLGTASPSDVGGCALDVDGDGQVDFVARGVWYRQLGDLAQPFERIVFDPELAKVHNLFAADIDGDGRMEIVTMSDKNNLRWYKIPADPAQPWPRHDVGPAVHAGASAGDIDGDGHLDLVRTDIWFRNVRGDGTEWASYPIGPNIPPPPRWYIWENLDGVGGAWQEHVILDANLGGHAAVVGDITGNGLPDIIAKPWRAVHTNALGGQMFLLFLENVSR